MPVVREMLRVSLFSSLALGIASLLLAIPPPAQAAAPDVVVLGANVDESSPEAGEAFGFVATVHNQGDAQSAVTTVRYLRSTNSTITTADALQGTGGRRPCAAHGHQRSGRVRSGRGRTLPGGGGNRGGGAVQRGDTDGSVRLADAGA